MMRKVAALEAGNFRGVCPTDESGGPDADRLGIATQMSIGRGVCVARSDAIFLGRYGTLGAVCSIAPMKLN